MSIVKVETPQGFYFTEGGGRYGRFYGSRWEGEMLCERHATEVIELYQTFASTQDGDDAHLVHVNGGRCQQCKRDKVSADRRLEEDGLISP